MRTVVQQSVVSRVDDGDMDKKKKRRSNRRSKQGSSSPACTSVNEIRKEGSEYLENGRRSYDITTSRNYSPPKPNGSANQSLNEEGAGASNVVFSSMPIIHASGQAQMVEGPGVQNQHPFYSDLGGRIFAPQRCDPVAYKGSIGKSVERDLLPFQCYPQRKCFTPYWSKEAVNDALENGNVFKALLRVNAHNRNEAYCKIDGVPTDILLNGIAQNRAVEGDIVAIKIDPVSLWAKMRGSIGSLNNSGRVEGCESPLEVNEIVGGSGKGKSKMDSDCEHAEYRSCLLPEIGSPCRDDNSLGDSSNSEFIGLKGTVCVNGDYPFAPDYKFRSSSKGIDDAVNAVERMSALVNSFPSKRPTGRVVAIIEKSPRRDTVIGFLNVKQWLSYRDGHRKDGRKNRNGMLVSDSEYIQLTPNDPKFPKMVVLVKSLPDCIRGRLETGDAMVEVELVAARMEHWGEECPDPQACVLQIFGRGSEVESRLQAILFEHAILTSEFSPESVSCLPRFPWEIPQEEYQKRRDLRNLCIFTIDPLGATDLDDALSVEKLSSGVYRVGVHIADASYFVLPDTALDMEAQLRSTSVYILHKKLPMLPTLLPENLGSLNPGVDRLAFSIFWDINCAGDIIDRWIGRTVIHSCCKLSYDDAEHIIDGTIDIESSTKQGSKCRQLHGCFEWSDVVRSVKIVYEISKTLKEKRFSDGALQLENSKVVFILDECGLPYDSMLSGRKDSNFLVEEFMLLANRTAAEIISRAYPDSALLRRHPEPNLRKLRELEAFCCKHGLELDTSSSGQFRQSLDRIREKLKDDSVLFDILISYAAKPMQLASYFCSGELKDNVNDWAHYALALPLYTHFTSPLRRYPDIIVHRTLAAALEAEELYSKYKKTVHTVNKAEESVRRYFTGVSFDRDAAESVEGKEFLSAASLKHGVPSRELLAAVAAHCNERKLASRHVREACDKLYTWVLLKKKEVLLSEARVLGLGPKFMSVYIQKLAIERRIYYEDVEGLSVEWLESTCTLVLSLKQSYRKGSPFKCRALGDVAWVVSPCNLNVEPDICGGHAIDNGAAQVQNPNPISRQISSGTNVGPAVFPLTVQILTTIPVALHPVGGDDGPLDIGVRLYMTSYLR